MASKDGNRKADRLTCELVHCLGQLDVTLGQAPGVVRRQGHFDGLVDVKPFRMVIELFRNERRARHEAEGLIEIGEHEFFRNRVATRYFAPSFEPAECALARVAGEFWAHVKLRKNEK